MCYTLLAVEFISFPLMALFIKMQIPSAQRLEIGGGSTVAFRGKHESNTHTSSYICPYSLTVILCWIYGCVVNINVNFIKMLMTPSRLGHAWILWKQVNECAVLCVWGTLNHSSWKQFFFMFWILFLFYFLYNEKMGNRKWMRVNDSR